MTSGGPQIPESPPKNPATSATPVSTRARWRRSKRGRQPASWLAPKSVTAAPRMPKSTRSGSATTSCAESAIIATSTRFSRQNRPRLAERRPDALPERLEQVRHQHRHDQHRHRHLVGQERPREAQARSAAARSPTTPLAKPPSATRQRRRHHAPHAVERDKSFQSRHSRLLAGKLGRAATLIKLPVTRPQPAAILRSPAAFALASTQPQHRFRAAQRARPKGQPMPEARPRPRARDAAPRRPPRPRRRRRRGRRRARRRRPRPPRRPRHQRRPPLRRRARGRPVRRPRPRLDGDLRRGPARARRLGRRASTPPAASARPSA